VTLAELPTPVVVVDRTRLLRNLDRAQELARSAGIALRPHVKTHKSPLIARWQLDRGASGICCAKLGEAEVFAAAGFSDIRLAYPINPANAARVLALTERTTLSIVIDHLAVAHAWSEVMRRSGRVLNVLIKVDVGFHRCGIDPEAHAVDFVGAVAALPGLRLCGLLSHAGHSYRAASASDIETIARREADLLLTLQRDAAAAGVQLDEISVGATPTLRFSIRERGVTEVRPGNYVFFDRMQLLLGSATLQDCALTVLATVVSKPARDRIILDCGSKTLSNDLSWGDAAYGAVLTADGRDIDAALTINRLSEEHATVSVRGATALEPGDRVHVLPNHACVVTNLVDEVQLVQDDELTDVLTVAARGRIT
jgi:D-serine deaminase-like pyridoxal phosphate-dependent protein